MLPDRHGSAVIEFPNELEVVIKREFDAPIATAIGESHAADRADSNANGKGAF